MIIFVGSLFTVAFTVFVGLYCADVALYINWVSLLIIVLPLLFFSCTSKSGRAIVGYIKSSFKKNHEYGTAELEIIATAAKNIVKVTLAAGWFGFLMGLIAILANLANPMQIGPHFAASLITLIYSIAISYFIFFPLQAWAEIKIRLIGSEL